MTRFLRTVTLLTLTLLSIGCTESSREQATGDAPVIGVNALVDAPDVAFMIEERIIGDAAFGGATSSTRWDDLSYNFNFDLVIPGNTSATRLATEFVDVQSNRSYLLVLAGSFDSPEVVRFEEDERQWDGTETVFEMTFAHLNNTTGPLDVYFAAPGTAPVLGNQVATVANGERSAAAEFAAGDFVVTVTTAGDPQDIVFTSAGRSFTAATTDTIFLLDQDPSRTDNMTVRHVSSTGATTQLADPRFPPRARAIHAAADIGNVDLFENDDFNNPLLVNQAFGDIDDGVPLTAGSNNYTWTDTGNSGAVILDEGRTIATGSRATLILVGPASDPDALNLLSVRRPFASSARIGIIHGAANYDVVDIYLLPAGESIADSNPSFPSVPFKFALATTAIQPDNYEITVTAQGENTVLAGPVAVDMAIRDVVDVLVLDTADPNVAELRVIRNTP